MKKYILMVVAMMTTLSLFAQDAAVASQPAAAANPDTFLTLTIACCAAAFLFIIIFALAKAVRALSTQVSS